MRIGIDNISAGEATTSAGPGGMRMYLREMVGGIASAARNDSVVLFTDENVEPLLEVVPQNLEVVPLKGVPSSRSARVFYQQTTLARAVRASQIDVLFAPATVMPLVTGVPTALAVQFLQFYRWPSAYGRMRTMYLKVILPLCVKKAEKVITFTDAARNELVRHTGVSREKVVVIPHGLPRGIFQLESVAATRSLSEVLGWHERPYILYVSALYGYKNHRRLIEAFSLLKARTSLPHRLVLVGGEAGVTIADLSEFARSQGVGDDVTITGRIADDRDVWTLYRHAELMAFPSPFETFGFPPLEAMACGCPVVVPYDGGSGELVGDAGLRVDVDDVGALAGAMERIVMDRTLRKQLVERGKSRARTFTWDRSIDRTHRAIAEIATNARR